MKHAAVVLGNYFVVFGGVGKDGYLADIHFLDTRKMHWENLGAFEKSNYRGERCVDEFPETPECAHGKHVSLYHNFKGMFTGAFPAARSGHTMAAWGGNIIIFGGFNKAIGLFNDVHVLDTKFKIGMAGTNLYGQAYAEKLFSGNNYKSNVDGVGNWGGMYTCPNGQVYAVGDTGNGCQSLAGSGGKGGECHKKTGPWSGKRVACGRYGMRTMQWRRTIVNGNKPAPRWGHAMYNIFPTAPQVLIFGGFGGAGEMDYNSQTDQLGFRNDHNVLDLYSPAPKSITVHPYGTPPKTVFHALHPKINKHVLDKYIKFHYEIPAAKCPGGTAPSSGLGWSPLFKPVTMTIKGNNFGTLEERTSAIAVVIGDARHGPFPCMPIKFISKNEVECTVSPGYGRDLDVTIYANNQISTPGNALFSYEPPRIIAVVPPFLIDFCYKKDSLDNCLPRGPIVVMGTNLGTSQDAVQSMVFGGAPCLNWLHVSPMVVVCLCVGESKKDKDGDPLQGGAIIKVGGQFSNPSPFKLIPAPKMLKESDAGVWYPEVCPLQKTLEALGFDFKMHRKVRAEVNYQQKSKFLTETIVRSLSATTLDGLVSATKDFVHAKAELQRAMLLAQQFQLPAGIGHVSNVMKQIARDASRDFTPVPPVLPFEGFAGSLYQNPHHYARGRRRRMLQLEDEEALESSRNDVVPVDIDDEHEDFNHETDSSKNVRMKEAERVTKIRKEQGLATPVPDGCLVHAQKVPNSSLVLGIEALGRLDVSKECGCDTMMARVKSRGFLSQKDLDGECKAALAHFAWRRACKEEILLYNSRCQGKSIQEDRSENRGNVSTIQTLEDNFKNLASYFRASASSSRQCNALRQIINMRCVEEDQKIPIVNKNPARRWVPFSPFDPRWTDTVAPENRVFGQIGNNGSIASMRFLSAKGKSDNIGNRITEAMAPVVNSVQAPLFIHPNRKPKTTAKTGKPKKTLPARFQGIVVGWQEMDKVCLPGKPPLPRRSMAHAGPMADGMSLFMFGGHGLDPPSNGSSNVLYAGDNLNWDRSKTITENFRMRPQTFDDTFLLTSLNELPEKNRRCFGVVEGICKFVEGKGHLFGTPAKVPDVPDNLVNNDGNGNIAPGEHNPKEKDLMPKDKLWSERDGNK
jgi:hypothetical protein